MTGWQSKAPQWSLSSHKPLLSASLVANLLDRKPPLLLRFLWICMMLPHYGQSPPYQCSFFQEWHHQTCTCLQAMTAFLKQWESWVNAESRLRHQMQKQFMYIVQCSLLWKKSLPDQPADPLTALECRHQVRRNTFQFWTSSLLCLDYGTYMDKPAQKQTFANQSCGSWAQQMCWSPALTMQHAPSQQVQQSQSYHFSPIHHPPATSSSLCCEPALSHNMGIH